VFGELAAMTAVCLLGLAPPHGLGWLHLDSHLLPIRLCGAAEPARHFGPGKSALMVGVS
jgi:hypothetical protein